MSNYGPPSGPYRDQPQDPWQARQQPHEPYEQPSDPWGGQDQWGGQPSSTPPGTPGSPSTGYDQPTYAQQQPGYGDQGYGDQRGYGYGDQPTYQDNQGYQGRDPGYDSRYGQPPTQHTTPMGPVGGAPPGGPPGGSPVWSAPAPPPRKRGASTGLVVLIVVLAVLVLGGGGTAYVLLRGDDKPTTTADPGDEPTTGPASPSAQAQDPTPQPSASGDSAADARLADKGQCLVNKGSNKSPKIEVVPCGKRTFEVLARFEGTADFKNRCAKVQGYTDHYFYDSEVDSLDFVLCLKRRR